MGYMISGKYQRLGYGREAVQAVLHYAEEELDAPRVVLRIDSDNRTSIQFAEQQGFKKMKDISEEDRQTSLYIYEL